MPIIWLPYFQSADPTVKRKSGFLMPMYAQSDRLGTTVTVPYYFALSDHYDFTFAPMYTSQQGVLWQGHWRHRLASGGYRVDLAGVFNDGSFEFPKDINSDFRGSVVTQGKFALNPYWSWGWDAIAESDDTFRRFYDLDSELKTDRISQLYLEGLHDRNYASMRFYETGTLLQTKDPLADATVYPIIDYDYIFKNPIVGGELSFNSNVMALANADGTDSNRLIMQTAWRRQMIDRIGEVFTPFAQLRGDLYGVNEFVDPATDLPVERRAGARHCRWRRGVSLSVHRHDRQRRPRLRADRARSSAGPIRSASISRRFPTRTRRAWCSTTPSCSTSTSSPVTTASRPARAPMSACATPRNCLPAPMPARCSARAISSPARTPSTRIAASARHLPTM